MLDIGGALVVMDAVHKLIKSVSFFVVDIVQDFFDSTLGIARDFHCFDQDKLCTMVSGTTVYC